MSLAIEETFPKIEIMQNASLSDYTNTDTGGPADWLAFPTTVEETQQLVKFAKNNQLAITIIGNASNLIVRDSGIEGLVIILTKMNTIEVSENKIIAQAGAALITASEIARDASLSGLEFAAGIPGSVGGAVFMNAGAYGGEISQVVVAATLLNSDGEVITLNADELDFGYRHSSIQSDGGVILAATFSLVSGDRATIKFKMDDFNARRADKQPLEWPSCGSVFKRPAGFYAGKLIHDAGLQGYTSGGAQVSKKHAGFIINIGEGTATDYLNVIKHVQDTVFRQFQVHLEIEVRVIGR
ncbi:UDP-N-acetylenolpyruvoylglucosamine reductase [Paucilactobacillus oligofermentans DSM 15707 = LMG 22743]|uniref:UDP-N-acetylenolpyruvoylglucosamine reductase n=1 Tax=Paucilactobacillus oligofermentans DSM 15707 = LMG 22743 TaxID=1423778 RepID=A0A0R1RLT3_9LACO|nr:UDP-N-acetylmuramate dehydrogenase [Paucilactobacillus oligofermentans]KRL57863.1 UDP-N-acetylenolpyruvoylglucosamine reductase [Paucilactobacillus oligofermentans DSM 15707 = LMG 22743]CUS26668.1 UDP-N-acetylmuramate dehydrogenase [Paucilactobacillus oligofermentans DSM 15707 = LMG 22743]